VSRTDCERLRSRSKPTRTWLPHPSGWGWLTFTLQLVAQIYVTTVAHFYLAKRTRSYGRGEKCIKIEHYLEVLRRKPGGLIHFQGWQKHQLPKCYEDLLQAMLQAGRSVKEFIEVLILRRDHADPEAVDSAVATSLIRRCPHLDAIRQLANRGPEAEFVPEPVEVPEALRTHRVTPPDVSCYQQLVMPGVES
jgi:hypothetical protein